LGAIESEIDRFSDAVKEKDVLNRAGYINLRNRYMPEHLRHVFVFESPPSSGLYFYDETGDKSEWLFGALMKFLNFTPTNKREGLEYFARCGYLLVDATYEPIDGIKGNLDRGRELLTAVPALIADLESVDPAKKAPLLLVKKSVCMFLEPLLKQAGFDVLNNGVVLPFPVPYQQKRFLELIAKFHTPNDPHA